jgi:hypothetical protein
MLINRRTIAKEKLEQLRNGQTAYAETIEVSDYMEKQIMNLEMDVVIDRTERGNWFYPTQSDRENTFE